MTRCVLACSVALVLYPGGHHAFEIVDDEDATREVSRTIEFVKRTTLPAYQTSLRRGLPEATAAAHVTSGNFVEAAASYAELVKARSDDARLRLAYGEALLGASQFAVLQEFYVQATRQTKADRIEHHQAVALIESWLRFPVQELTVPILQAALVTREHYQIGYWDAAIIEAGRAAGCRDILSEDLQDGRDYGGVRVTNPFRGL